MWLKIISERHKVQHGLNYHAEHHSKKTAKASPLAVFFNRPKHSLKSLKYIIFKGNFKTADEHPFVYKRSYTNWKHYQRAFLPPYSEVMTTYYSRVNNIDI